MTAIYDAASLAVLTGAILAGGLVLAGTRQVAPALAVLLDLLLAAGLLRLAAEPTWTRLATAAAVVAVRKLAG